MAKKNVAVLGAGMMGTGIAQLFASKGHKVMLIYVYDDKVRAKPVETMRGNLQVLVDQGVIDESQVEETINNVSFTEDLKEAAEFADLRMHRRESGGQAGLLQDAGRALSAVNDPGFKHFSHQHHRNR